MPVLLVAGETDAVTKPVAHPRPTKLACEFPPRPVAQEVRQSGGRHYRRWEVDRRGGEQSASVMRMVGVAADMETRNLQVRFNKQSRSKIRSGT
jgi:hypothetical protein